MIKRTWFWEQAVFAACLALAVYGQVRVAGGAEAGHRLFGAVVAALAAFAAQKVRSGADRQREQDELHGVERARLACAKRIDRWAELAQLASVGLVATSIVSSGVGWSLPAMIFTSFYPIWRKVYREFVPVKSDDKNVAHVWIDAQTLTAGLSSVERLVASLQPAQRVGENLIDTAERLVAEAREREATDDYETTVFTSPQPAPVNGSGPALWPMIADELDRDADTCGDRVWHLVAEDARDRHEFGVAKYGVPLVADNGRDHLADAYLEALDGTVYLRAAVERGDRTARAAYCDMLDMAIRLRGMLLTRDGR